MGIAPTYIVTVDCPEKDIEAVLELVKDLKIVEDIEIEEDNLGRVYWQDDSGIDWSKGWNIDITDREVRALYWSYTDYSEYVGNIKGSSRERLVLYWYADFTMSFKKGKVIREVLETIRDHLEKETDYDVDSYISASTV